MRYKHAVALAIVFLAAGAFAQPARAEASFELFYSNLSPHGAWLVSAQYGRVWQPSIYRPGWNPYYDGHWQYTDLGWAWVSDYEWGATPYHYGTWVDDPGMGWVWMPGYVWAPSWVVFSSGPDYIGWAPVPPDFSLSVTIGPRDINRNHFVFVPAGRFLSPRVRGCALPPSRNTVIVNRTRIVNNITVQNNVVVNRGPDVTVVERASGRRIQPVPIERVQRVSPARSFTREEFRLDARRNRRTLRVAEPRPGNEPLPPPPPHPARAESARPLEETTTPVGPGATRGRRSENMGAARRMPATAGVAPPAPQPEPPRQNGPASAKPGAQPPSGGASDQPAAKKKGARKDSKAGKQDDRQNGGDPQR